MGPSLHFEIENPVVHINAEEKDDDFKKEFRFQKFINAHINNNSKKQGDGRLIKWSTNFGKSVGKQE
jgi:hypothetical protein